MKNSRSTVLRTAKRPCKRCGSLERYARSGQCVSCLKRKYRDDREYRARMNAASRKRNVQRHWLLSAVRSGVPGVWLENVRKPALPPQAAHARSRAARRARSDEDNFRRRIRRLLDPGVAARDRETGRRWSASNAAYITAKTRLRKELQRSRAPRWLTREQRCEIREFYRRARDYTELSGSPYHVDHIVPLCGRNVSGLHVPWNLRIVPATENMRKGNRWHCPHELAG